METATNSQGIEFKLPHITSTTHTQISSKSYDYIVIGGGATGCPLVTTLSQKYSVLLLERGLSCPYNDPLITDSRNYSLPLVQSNEFSSIAQTFVSKEGVKNARGRVLGGSTAINFGFYSRGSQAFHQTLGWDEELVREAYEWVEEKIVFEPRELSEWQSVVKDSLVEVGLGFNGFSLEHIAGTKVGGSIFDGNGKRHSSAELLGYGDLERITVLLNATVKNLIFFDNGTRSTPKVSGVRFIKSDGDGDEIYEAYLNQPKHGESSGDVILSAGALGSPQILMLSGIGPQEHLKHFNISPVIDAIKVGKDIKDNPKVSLLIDSFKNRKADLAQVVGIAQDFQTIVEAATKYITPNETAWGIGAKMTFPISKGMLELNNTDPRQNPIVRFNYLGEKQDLDHCVKMGSLLEKITQSSSMKGYLGIPQNEDIKLSTDEELSDYCKKNVGTFYHYHGGCGIGSVVDKDFRVYGVEGLRVIDGSTLPDSPGTNPMATLLMIGRYQGIKILEERGDVSVTCVPGNNGDHFSGAL